MNPYERLVSVAKSMAEANVLERAQAIQPHTGRKELIRSLTWTFGRALEHCVSTATPTESLFMRFAQLASAMRALDVVGVFKDLRSPPVPMYEAPEQRQKTALIESQFRGAMRAIDALAMPDQPDERSPLEQLRDHLAGAERVWNELHPDDQSELQNQFGDGSNLRQLLVRATLVADSQCDEQDLQQRRAYA